MEEEEEVEEEEEEEEEEGGGEMKKSEGISCDRAFIFDIGRSVYHFTQRHIVYIYCLKKT